MKEKVGCMTQTAAAKEAHVVATAHSKHRPIRGF
jgi:hypothetical protein